MIVQFTYLKATTREQLKRNETKRNKVKRANALKDSGAL